MVLLKTAFKYQVAIKWKTRQVKILFPLKDKSIHKSCVIYTGTCSYGETYIGKTRRNALIGWEEHQTLLRSQILLNI